MHRRSLLIGALAAGAWSAVRAQSTPAPAADPAWTDYAALEPLYAVTAGPHGLTVRVGSKGCTRKADFTFYVARKPGGAQIAFGRKRLEACKPKRPGHADLVFTYAELGVSADTPLFILNPIAPGP